MNGVRAANLKMRNRISARGSSNIILRKRARGEAKLYYSLISRKF